MVLPMLKRFNPGDIHIRHHYATGRVRLHTYRHKGYWFYGRRREESTMEFFRQAVQPGDTVLEIGGHIGYITMWLAELVGDAGRVVVFEPGRNNLPYLRANVQNTPMVEICPLAVANFDGAAPFFEEELTGQNNSLLSDYAQFQDNRARAFSNVEYKRRETQVVRLDTWVRERGLVPQLIKLDIEGAESLALEGAVETLANYRPIILVEVTRNRDTVWRILNDLAYEMFTPEWERVTRSEDLNGNICVLDPLKHARLL
jgi:FkbM family methyltransferase